MTPEITFTTRPTLQGTFGMVSSTHWIASQSAMRALERGANAFDAAVTAGFVLHVVEPHLNGPGGEVPAIVATAQHPLPRVLAGQGPAPAGATIEHFTSLGFDLVPGSGPLAAGEGMSAMGSFVNRVARRTAHRYHTLASKGDPARRLGERVT